jgi:hypothetical protein
MIQRDSALLSRRILLAGLGVGAIGAVGALSGGAPALGVRRGAGASADGESWWDRTSVSLRAAGLDEWSGAVGRTFTAASPNGSHKLRVAAVAPFAPSGRRPAALGRSEAFSVVFELVGGPRLPAADGLYELIYGAYSALPVYMSAPFGSGRGTRLIAVFN